MKLNLLELRKEKNMTQEALAQLTGQTQATISNYENGTHVPTIPTCERICDALDCTLSELFSEE